MRSDVEFMLNQAGIPFPKDATKKQLCSLLSRNIPRRILEAILIYGSQVGKGAAVSVVLALLIGSIFAPGVVAPIAAQTITSVPVLYGAVTGIYDGTKTVFKRDKRAYRNISRRNK